MSKPIPCIIYKSPRSGNERKIVVVNGMPFYESTGQNSGASETWFPFIMIRGTREINFENIPPDLASLGSIIRAPSENYIVKYESGLLNGDLLEIYDGRVPTKETLIISSRLNPISYSREMLLAAGLSQSEVSLAQSRLKVSSENIKIITDTDAVNDWLIDNGAEIISQIFGKKINKAIATGVSEQSRQYLETFKSETSRELNEVENKFLTQLCHFHFKADELEKKGHLSAAITASSLHETLYQNFKAFVEGKLDENTFKKLSQNALNNARPELEKFRDMKLVLANLGLLIISLGVGYLIAGLANLAITGNFLLFRTDSARKLDDLSSNIMEVAPGA